MKFRVVEHRSSGNGQVGMALVLEYQGLRLEIPIDVEPGIQDLRLEAMLKARTWLSAGGEDVAQQIENYQEHKAWVQAQEKKKAKRLAQKPEARGQETIPRHDGGTDWGHDLVVLIRKGQKVMVVWPGHLTWGGIGQDRHYFETRTMLLDRSKARGFSSEQRDLFEGRVTKARLEEAMPRIREFFGHPELTVDQISRQKTLVLK